MTNTIKIQVERGSADCETCGFYDLEYVTVTKDGELVLEHEGDSHLGGNQWYEWESAVQDILKALGYDVVIKEISQDD